MSTCNRKPNQGGKVRRASAAVDANGGGCHTFQRGGALKDVSSFRFNRVVDPSRSLSTLTFQLQNASTNLLHVPQYGQIGVHRLHTQLLR